MFCASVSGHRYFCSKFITAHLTSDRGSDMIKEVFIFVLWVLYLCLYPCCFCKLLGLCFMHSLWALWYVPCFRQPLCFVESVLLTKCHAFYFKYCHSFVLVGLFLDAYI